MTERIHISHQPIGTLSLNHKSYRDQRVDHKPVGFWWGVDGDWERWCKSDMPDWIGKFRYEVDISKANILILPTALDIRLFSDQFGCSRPGMERFSSLGDTIDWRRVAEEYDGIEIAPYQWSLRMADGFMWYYGFDCASGCVWNLEKSR